MEEGVVQAMTVLAYRTLAYVGLTSIFGSLIWGFRFDGEAPASNYAWNLGLYAAFIAPHLILTRSWLKAALWGNPAGHPKERRVYIVITVLTWFAVLWFHRPLPGISLNSPEWVRFVGLCLLLIAVLHFFQGVSFAMIDGLLGVPGSASAYSHGPNTPLFSEGPYSGVRHPMYRAALMACAASWIVHPDTSQLFWTVLISGSFVSFIPVEEAQMIRARGDDYRAYQRATPWRLLRGIW